MNVLCKGCAYRVGEELLRLIKKVVCRKSLR